MKILYLCTHNRCRSILAEGLTRHLAPEVFDVRSAGSTPVDRVHPLTIHHLGMHGVSVADLRSKSWDELEDFAPDLVITLCDDAANETCPLWMGNALKLHWPLADPSRVEGSLREKDVAFEATIQELKRRIAAFAALEPDRLDRGALREALAALGATG